MKNYFKTNIQNDERRVDLHTHSTASDGADTPSELVQKAVSCGLSAIALCDHDTVSGLEEFLFAAEKYNIEAVPGIEISTKLFSREIHILGLYVDMHCEQLKKRLSHLLNTRKQRNHDMIAKMRANGIDISEEEVALNAQGESIGRPHIAKTLVQKGYVDSIQTAFEKYLKNGRKFYIPREFLSPEETIELIHQSSGLAFWAHPMHSQRSERSVLRKFLSSLTPIGLDGIECRYSLFTKQQETVVSECAEKFNLLMSGGSDYHGLNQPSVHLGTGMGNLFVPYSFLEKIKSRKQMI